MPLRDGAPGFDPLRHVCRCQSGQRSGQHRSPPPKINVRSSLGVGGPRLASVLIFGGARRAGRSACRTFVRSVLPPSVSDCMHLRDTRFGHNLNAHRRCLRRRQQQLSRPLARQRPGSRLLFPTLASLWLAEESRGLAASPRCVHVTLSLQRSCPALESTGTLYSPCTILYRLHATTPLCL